jgi:amicyanin
MIKKLLPVLVLLTLLLSACNVITSSSGTQPPPVVETQLPVPSENEVFIIINKFKFEPRDTTVKAGTKVTWINEDSFTHDIIGEGNSFVSPSLLKGQRFSITFAQAGTYNYSCGIHPVMKGAVIVE